VLSALRRHWIVAIVPVIVLVGVAAALGLQRTPRYTATASLSVGRIYINNPAGVSSVLEATKSLASVYSRSIRSTAVLQDTERRLGEGSLGASDRVTATPIPQSPLIRISAESSSARRAVALATAASGALAAYVARQERSDEDSVILASYRQAERRYQARVQQRARLARRYGRDPTPTNKAARDQATVAVSVALLRRDAVRASYLNLVQGTGSAPAVEEFTRASDATSDRMRMLQIMLLLGLIAGLAAGVALAMFRARNETRPYAGE
jgi:hypothetical protein